MKSVDALRRAGDPSFAAFDSALHKYCSIASLTIAAGCTAAAGDFSTRSK